MDLKNWYKNTNSAIPPHIKNAGIILIILIIGYGIIGSHYLMKLNLIDSVYFTIITIATVGFGDIIPITPLQKIFVITLAFAGIGLIAYIFTTLISNFVLKIEMALSGSKMKKKIENITEHYILCGYGRVGTVVLEELKKRNQKVIIVENDKEIIEKLNKDEEIISNENIVTLYGDATDNDIIKKFKIKESLGLILTTGSDVTNLFIVLTLRDLAPNAWIVSRASKKENIHRLYNAGANKVISPEASGGNDIYYAAVKPNLIRITDTHGLTDTKKEIEIITKNHCTIENIEYHFPGIKKPFVRKIGVISKENILKYDINENKNKNEVNSLEVINELSNGIHSHWISGPDQKTLNKVIKELETKNLVVGVGMSDEEILKLNNENIKDIYSHNL